MKDLAANFLIYYSKKFNNRKLEWLNQYGTLEITPTYTEKKNYSLIVNVYQASILSIYNDANQYTVK